MPSRAVIKAAARAARQNNTLPAASIGAGVSPMMAQYNSYGGALSYGNFLPRPPETFADGGFSPLTPILPMGVDQPAADGERPEPRRFQFPVGWNMIQTPGAEGLGKLADFTTLRLIADYSSIARACIQLRKAEIRSLAWDIVPTRDAAKAMRGDRPAHVDFAARKAEALKFFRRPDPNYSDFSSWLDAVLEDIFVIDALSIYLHPARIQGKGLLGSDLAALALLDGSTVRPLLSLHGERPRPPAPAYSQYLYGAPRTDLMTVITGEDLDDLDQPAAKYRGDQLLYLPMNPRDWSPYGQAPAERCIVPIMASLQRQQWQANYFQEGTVPSVFVSPGDENMTPGQIATLQGALNAIAGDPAWKHKIIVLPGGSRVDPMHVTELADQFDEVIAVQVCMGYDVMPMELGISPKVSATQSSGAANQMAKASQSINQRKSLKPLLAFLKSTIFDMALQDICGQPDMQWHWEGLEEGEDEESKTNILMTQVNAGFRSHDEARLELGLEPWGLPITSDPGVMTQQGFVPLGAIDPQTGMPSAQQPALPSEAGEVSPPAAAADAAGTPSHAGASAAVAEHDTQGPNQAAKPAGASTKNASGYALNTRSGMISLDVPDGVIEPVPGGVTDHHVTVVYLGSDVDDDAFALACDRARSAAASVDGPVTAVLAGIDSFEPSAGSDGKVPAFIPVVSPGIEAVAGALRDLSASEYTEFHPHVTLAYLDQGDPLPDPVEPVRVMFTELSVHRGGDVVRIPFGDVSPGACQGGGPSRKAALAELDALGRHLKKGRRITTWVSRHLPAVTLATVSKDLATGLTVDEAVMVARSTLPPGGDGQEGEQPAVKTSRRHWPGWDVDQRLATDFVGRIQSALAGVFDAVTARRIAGDWLQVASGGQSAQTWLQWNEPGLTDRVTTALRPVLTGLWRQAWTVGHAASQAVLDGKHHVDWSKVAPGVAKAGRGGIDASAMVYDQQSLEEWLTHYGIAGISSIADTRMADLAELLESALEDGDSPDTLAAEIADLGASTDRATMIAVTEIARAVSQAALANYEQAGVRQVSWLTVAGACKLCTENESVGAIRLGDSFPSGADAPPGHPRCRCALLASSVDSVSLPTISGLQDILGGSFTQ